MAGYPLELSLDTGFAGGILIPFPLFQSLGLLSALTPDEYRLVLPDSRRLPLYTAKEDVLVGGETFGVEIHSTPLVNRRIAGRSFLRQFVATLDGPGEELKLRGVRQLTDFDAK